MNCNNPNRANYKAWPDVRIYRFSRAKSISFHLAKILFKKKYLWARWKEIVLAQENRCRCTSGHALQFVRLGLVQFTAGAHSHYALLFTVQASLSSQIFFFFRKWAGRECGEKIWLDGQIMISSWLSVRKVLTVCLFAQLRERRFTPALAAVSKSSQSSNRSAVDVTHDNHIPERLL